MEKTILRPRKAEKPRTYTDEERFGLYDFRKEVPLYRSKVEALRAIKGHKARLERENGYNCIEPTVVDYCNSRGETVILSESASRRIAERQEKNCIIDRDAIMSAAERADFIKQKALYLMQKHPNLSKRKAKDTASAILDAYLAEQMDTVRMQEQQKRNAEKARTIAQLPVINGVIQCPDYTDGKFAKKKTVAQKQRSKAKSSKDIRSAMERGEKPAQKTTEQHLKDVKAKLRKVKRVLESCITAKTKADVKRLEREVQLWKDRFTTEQKQNIIIRKKNAS